MLKLKRKIIFYCGKHVICTLELDNNTLPIPKVALSLKERVVLQAGKGNFTHGYNCYYEIEKTQYYYDTATELEYRGRKQITYERINVRYNNIVFQKLLNHTHIELEESLQKVKDISDILYKKYGIHLSWAHTEFLLNNGFFVREEFAKHGIQL